MITNIKDFVLLNYGIVETVEFFSVEISVDLGGFENVSKLIETCNTGGEFWTSTEFKFSRGKISQYGCECGKIIHIQDYIFDWDSFYLTATSFVSDAMKGYVE